MAARLTKRLANQTRDGIKTSMLINRLEDHSLGKIKLEPSQVQAIRILLAKTLPDLSATTVDATVQDERAETMTDAQLLAIAGGRKSA